MACVVSSDGRHCGRGGTAPKRELEVEPENVAELQQPRDKSLADAKELLPMGEQRRWFLRTESTPVKML